MKKTLLALAGSLAITTTGWAFELEQESIRLDKIPKVIAIYDLAILDSLNALGIEVQGVPKSNYQDNLAKFNKATQIGSLFEPDYQVLKQLKPELIFAGGRSGKAIPELSKVAPVANYTLDRNNFLASFKRTSLNLAKAFAKEQEAQSYIQAIEKNTQQLASINKGKTGIFLFTINGAIMAHAPNDRFGYSYELTGLQSVIEPKAASPRTARPAPNSPEAKKMQAEREAQIKAIAAANPDWLLVLDRGAINGGEKTAAATLKNHPELSQTSAYQQGRVIYLEPDSWYIFGGGLNNLKNITQRLVEQMQ